MYGRDTVLSGRFLFPVQAALGAADASVPAPRTPAKYIGGEIRVKHDLGFTSISMAYSAPGGADTSKYQVILNPGDAILPIPSPVNCCVFLPLLGF